MNAHAVHFDAKSFEISEERRGTFMENSEFLFDRFMVIIHTFRPVSPHVLPYAALDVSTVERTKITTK